MRKVESRKNILRKMCIGLFAITILFSGCNKNNNSSNDSNSPQGGNEEVGGNDGITKIEVYVEDGRDYSGMIDRVKLLLEDDETPLATADYNDGRFTFNLPSNVPAGHLYGMSYYASSSSTLTISNPNAQLTEAYIAGFKGDKEVCYFYYEKEDNGSGRSIDADIMYVNSAISISGTETYFSDRDITSIYDERYTYSVNAKRGWNMWYTIREQYTTTTANGVRRVYNSEHTTTEPSGLKWYVNFNNNDYYDGITLGSELKINAQVENGNLYSNIRRVRINGTYGRAVAVGNYANGGFSLTLPNKAYPEQSIEIFFSYEYGVSSGINISNENAKIVSTSNVEGYSSSSGEWNWDSRVGYFIYGKIEPNSTVRVMYMFVTDNVNVNGSGSGYYSNINCSMNLKAGWNTVYVTEYSSGDREISTSSVSGLKWYYMDDFHSIAPFPVKSLTNGAMNGKSGIKRIFNKSMK